MEEKPIVSKIGNAEYKIYFLNNDFDKRLYLKDDEKYHFGIINFADEEIYINGNLTLNKIKQTLVHEITHAFINEFGFKAIDYFNEEQICEFMSMYGDKILILCTSIIEQYNLINNYGLSEKEERNDNKGIEANK